MIKGEKKKITETTFERALKRDFSLFKEIYNQPYQSSKSEFISMSNIKLFNLRMSRVTLVLNKGVIEAEGRFHSPLSG